MSALPRCVRIVEVGPRDGLQNEGALIPTKTKIEFVGGLIDAGLSEIETTSFVAPLAVPQLADAAEVAAGTAAFTGARLSALVPNMVGLRRAIEAGVKRIAVFTAASDTFARRNINMTVDESLAVFQDVVAGAAERGMSARGYISTGFVCPYEGPVAKERVREIAERLLAFGVDEIAIGDTIGAAVPTDVVEVVDCLLERIPREKIALHLHDTYGMALANAYAGLQAGIETFDASAGGLGGCPYAPGAAGNLATEDLVYLLDGLGIETGVDLEGVFAASRLIAKALGRVLPGKQYQRLVARGDDA